MGRSPAPRAGAASFLKGWQTIGLPAFACIFLPWQNKLTEMSMISDYFQPALNIGASIVGPLSCFVGYAYLVHKSRAKQQQIMFAGFLTFLVSLLLLYAVKMTLGIAFIPERFALVGIWIAKIFVYLVTFSALAVSMIAGGLLIKRG
jgi:hypothetical protein